MAFQIRVIPEALRAEAQNFQGKSQQAEEITSKLNSVRSRLDSAWDGSSSRDMLEKMDSILKMPKEAAEDLKQAADELRTVADSFEALDTGTGAQFKPFPTLADILKLLDFKPDFLNIIASLVTEIRVIPDELRVAASEMRQIAESALELAGSVIESLNALESSWEGKLYQNFKETYSGLDNAFKDFSDAILQAAERLQSAADRYEEIDNSLG